MCQHQEIEKILYKKIIYNCYPVPSVHEYDHIRKYVTSNEEKGMLPLCAAVSKYLYGMKTLLRKLNDRSDVAAIFEYTFTLVHVCMYVRTCMYMYVHVCTCM